MTRETMMIDRRTGDSHRNGNAFAGFELIDGHAKSGASFLVGNPETGDLATAYWHHDLWALYCGPKYDTVEQLDFEPTHYRPRT